MLRAEQDALEQQGRAELLRILEREFEYYKSAYESVGTQAALIAGFTVAVLVTLDISDDSRKADGMHPTNIPEWVKSCYHVTSFLALITLIHTVMSVTFVVVWGPGLALRGSSPLSMETAVRGMKAEKFMIYFSFFVGVTSFLLMSLSVAWIQMNADIALVCSAFFVGMTALLMYNGVRIHDQFRVQQADPVAQHGPRSFSEVDSRPSKSSHAYDRDRQSHIRSEHNYRPSFNIRPSAIWRRNQNEDELKQRLDPGETPSGMLQHNDSFTPTVFPASGNDTASSATAVGATTDLRPRPSNRTSAVSEPDNADVLATTLANERGGWLLKKQTGLIGGDGWKRRWVRVQHGFMYYSRSPGEKQEKQIALEGMQISLGNDGMTLRLHDENSTRVVDWKCATPLEREGWVHYIRSGKSS